MGGGGGVSGDVVVVFGTTLEQDGVSDLAERFRIGTKLHTGRGDSRVCLGPKWKFSGGPPTSPGASSVQRGGPAANRGGAVAIVDGGVLVAIVDGGGC